MTYLGELAALTTAVLWAVSSFIFTDAVHKLNYIHLNILRLFFALIYLMITILFAGLSFKITGNQIVFLTLSGLFGLVFGDSFLFNAFKIVGPRISLLLMTLSPAATTLMAYFVIGESMSYFDILGIVITIFGILVVIYENKNPDNNGKFKLTSKGISFAAIAAIGQAIGLIFVKMTFLEGEVNGFIVTFYRIAASVILFIPYILKNNLIKVSVDFFKKDNKSFAYILFGSILGPFLGITLSIISVKFTQTGIAATLMATVPIIMLPLTKIIYKEKISWQSVVGAFIAVAGVSCIFIY